MRLIHQLSTDLSGTVHLGALAVPGRSLLLSVLTIAAVMLALTLPFPRGDGSIRRQAGVQPAAASARQGGSAERDG